jgi:uncharacterized membrane protein
LWEGRDAKRGGVGVIGPFPVAFDPEKIILTVLDGTVGSRSYRRPKR